MTGQRIAECHVTCLLGPVAVELTTDQPTVVDYLAEFYPITTTTSGEPDWVVDARVGPGGAMRRNPYGVAYAADPAVRVIVVRADNPLNLAMTTRKTVRETLVGFCEYRRYTMLHASAIADDRRVVIVAGDKGSGKTTLALRGAMLHGMRYISNDHLIIYPDGSTDAEPSSRLVLTSLPTPIPVKVGTYLDLEHLLPEPWDTGGIDLALYREMRPSERYHHDARVLYTYRRLGQDNPVTVPLRSPHDGPQVTVVLARYTTGGELPRDPVPVPDPVPALREHVRFDWMFDPMLNQRHLPRRERGRAAYAADADRLARALAARADVVAWAHDGDPGPLLGLLGGRP